MKKSIILIILFISLFAAIAFYTSPARSLNILLGCAVFFFPGYTLFRLFVRNKGTDLFVTWALSFLLSLAITPALVYAGFLAGMPVTLYNTVALTILFCVVLFFANHVWRYAKKKRNERKHNAA